MAAQIQLTFLLAIACVVYSTLIVEQSIDYNLEIRVNLDKVIDSLLPSIRKFIVNNGMDPMQLPNVSTNIFPVLPGKLKGNIVLKKGWMQNLSLVKRTRHVTAIYNDSHLTLDMNLGFDVMDFNYQYYLNYLMYKRRGDMFGRLYNLDVNVVIKVDLNDYYLILNSFKFSNVWKLDVQFRGHLLDFLVNALTKVITTVFRDPILRAIENYSTLMFGTQLVEWNTLVPLENRTKIINGWLDIAKEESH